MKLEAIMTPSPRVCRPQDSLQDAAELMWSEDCGCLPVVDDASQIVGLITDRDVCMGGMTRRQPLDHLYVADSMQREVKTCRATETVENALDLMRSHQIRRVPIVDTNDHVVGIVAVADVARAAAAKQRGISGTAFVATLGAISANRNAEPDVDLAKIAAQPRTAKKTATKKTAAKKRKSARAR